MSDQDSEEHARFIKRWSARKRNRTTQLRSDSGNSEPVVAGNSVDLNPVGISPIATVDSNADVDMHSSDEIQANCNDVDAGTEKVQASSEPQAIEQAPLLSDEDMPSISSLTAKSDLSDFFNKGVSAGLRRAALRHVFQLPVYNVRDGLNDYDDDFTKFEPLGDTITSDMKWHKARKERKAEEAAAAELKAQEEQAQQEIQNAESADLEEQGESQNDVEQKQASEEHDEHQSDAEATHATAEQTESNPTQDDIEPSEHQAADDSVIDDESEMNKEQEADQATSEPAGAHA